MGTHFIETPLFWGDLITSRWREFTIPIPSVSADMNIPSDSDEDDDYHRLAHGGGTSFEIGNRILCWRVRGKILEIVETSFNSTLVEAALRFRFPARVLPKVSAIRYGTSSFCVVATTEAGTIHRLVFTINDSNSILESFSYAMLQNPGHHVVLSGSHYHKFTCSAAIDARRVVLGTDEGSLFVVELNAVESARNVSNEPVSVDILRPQGAVQRILGALMTPFKRRSTEVAVKDVQVYACDNSNSGNVTASSGDIFLLALCADNCLRVWSLSHRSLALSLPVAWDGINLEHQPQSREGARDSDDISSGYYSDSDIDNSSDDDDDDDDDAEEEQVEVEEDVNVNFCVVPWEGQGPASFAIVLTTQRSSGDGKIHSQIQIYRATVPFGSLTLGGSVGECRVIAALDRIVGGPTGYIVDIKWYKNRAWVLWRENEGRNTGVSAFYCPLSLSLSDHSHVHGQIQEECVRVIDDEAIGWLEEFAVGVTPDEDPEDFFADKLFAAHRFPTSVLHSAIEMTFGEGAIPRGRGGGRGGGGGSRTASVSNSLILLRQAAAHAARSEAVRVLNEAGSTVPPMNPIEFHRALANAWNRLALNTFECWDAEADPISLICGDAVAIVRRGGLSVVRAPATVAEAIDLSLTHTEDTDTDDSIKIKMNVNVAIAKLAHEVAVAVGPAAVSSISDGLDDLVEPLEACLGALSNPIAVESIEMIRIKINRIKKVALALGASITMIDALEMTLDGIDDLPSPFTIEGDGDGPGGFGSGPAVTMAGSGVVQALTTRYRILKELALLCVYLIQARRTANLSSVEITKLTESVAPKCGALLVYAHAAIALCTGCDATVSVIPNSDVACMVARPIESADSECGATLFDLDTLSSPGPLMCAVSRIDTGKSRPSASILAQGLHTMSISQHLSMSMSRVSASASVSASTFGPNANTNASTSVGSGNVKATSSLIESSIVQLVIAARVPMISATSFSSSFGATHVASAIHASLDILSMRSVESVVSMLAFLARLGLYGHVQALARLLKNYENEKTDVDVDVAFHSAVSHFKGEAYLSSGEPEKALDCFMEAVAGLKRDRRVTDMLKRMIVGSMESEMESESLDLDLSRVTVRYMIHCMHLFEQYLQPRLAIKCAQAALGFCANANANSTDLSIQIQERALWTAVFQHELGLGHYDSAFLAAASNPDPSLRKDAIVRLVAVLCEARQLDKLCSGIPFGNLSDIVSKALLDRAHRTPLESGGRWAYQVLYSWHVYRSAFRRAALAMVELAEMEEMPSKRSTALAAAVNALKLVESRSAWLRLGDWDNTSEHVHDHHHDTRDAGLTEIGVDIDVGIGAEEVEGEAEGDEPLRMSAMDIDSGAHTTPSGTLELPEASKVLLRMRMSTRNKQVESQGQGQDDEQSNLRSLNMNMTKSYVVDPPVSTTGGSAKSLSLKVIDIEYLRRELVLALSHKDLGGSASLKMKFDDTLALLLDKGLFERAADLCDAYGHDHAKSRRRVIKALASGCARSQLSGDGGDWMALKGQLDRWSGSSDDLAVVAAASVLSTDSSLRLPDWLADACDGSSGEEGALIRLYLKFDRTDEAEAAAVRCIERSTMKLAESKGCAATFVPFSAIDAVIARARSKLDDKEAPAAKSALEQAVDAYLEKVKIHNVTTLSKK